MNRMSPEEVVRRHKIYDEATAARKLEPWHPHESIPSGTPVKVHILSKTHDGVQVRDVVMGNLGPVLRVVKIGNEQMTLGCSQVEIADHKKG